MLSREHIRRGSFTSLTTRDMGSTPSSLKRVRGWLRALAVSMSTNPSNCMAVSPFPMHDRARTTPPSHVCILVITIQQRNHRQPAAYTRMWPLYRVPIPTVRVFLSPGPHLLWGMEGSTTRFRVHVAEAGLHFSVPTKSRSHVHVGRIANHHARHWLLLIFFQVVSLAGCVCTASIRATPMPACFLPPIPKGKEEGTECVVVVLHKPTEIRSASCE